eukprot:11005529-Alexandrium_andersonii.AAC.1
MPQPATDEQNRAAAVRWARQGNAGRALQALVPAGIAEPNAAAAAAVAEAMCATPTKGPGPADATPAGPRRTGLTIKQMRRRFRGLKQGIGPSLLGWPCACSSG